MPRRKYGRWCLSLSAGKTDGTLDSQPCYSPCLPFKNLAPGRKPAGDQHYYLYVNQNWDLAPEVPKAMVSWTMEPASMRTMPFTGILLCTVTWPVWVMPMTEAE